ncbi:MAG: MFS transporter, partial [Parafilimonas terrae]|nr:MFS transporter [Parafilimonas terrae]
YRPNVLCDGVVADVKAVPMYQSESLPKWIRGFVVGCYQLCITIGLLLASLCGAALVTPALAVPASPAAVAAPEAMTTTVQMERRMERRMMHRRMERRMMRRHMEHRMMRRHMMRRHMMRHGM